MDLLTIGAGGGAYPAAFRLAKVGHSAVMVDPKGIMSGNCLYEGCVPSKAIRETIDLFSTQKRFSTLGLKGDVTADYSQIVAHKDAIQSRRNDQHKEELAAVSGISLIKGTARIIDPHRVAVMTDNGEEFYQPKQIIIASGTDVFVPPLSGSELCITSHDIYKIDPKLKNIPEHLIVVGGGYIGVETASFFATLGSKVTLLEKAPQILEGGDPEMISLLLPLLNPRIKIVTGVSVTSISKGEKNQKSVHYLNNGKTEQIQGDTVLLAAGRKPIIPAGTSEIGIEVSKRGIEVGPSLQTKYPHIYACGDINGRVPLFHAAVQQSLVAAHNILGGNRPLDYADFVNVPTTIFTLPAAAYVGITPTKAKKLGIEIVRARYDFKEDSRAQILEQMEGEIQLFFSPGNLRLLGGWVVGIDAGHLIGQIGIATANGLTAYDIARFPDQHPMSSEGISKAARSLF